MNRKKLRPIVVKKKGYPIKVSNEKEGRSDLFYFHKWFEKKTEDGSYLLAVVEDEEGKVKAYSIDDYTFQFIDINESVLNDIKESLN